MKASLRLFGNTCRITLFTRSNCGLCDTAKNVLHKVQEKKPFDFEQINVMEPGQAQYQAMYEFDTPVIHVEKAAKPLDAGHQPAVAASQKLMHRFSETQVEDLIKKVEGS